MFLININFNLLSKTIFIIVIILLNFSCSVQKTGFTVGLRKDLEEKSIDLKKLQFYVDRDVELRRELTSSDLKVSSGKVKFENGKYIHIILLKEKTPGICTNYYSDRVEVSFELGDGKTLTFGEKNGNEVASSWYEIFANKWVFQDLETNLEDVPGPRPKSKYWGYGIVWYDNKWFELYGQRAGLMINKSVVDKLKVDKQVMKGRRIE
jgi:hypothetical protein